MKQQCLISFPFGKQDFKYFIGYKNNKEIRLLTTFFPEMSMQKIYFNKTICIYFMTKDEKFFDKSMTIQENITKLIKKHQ